MAHITSELTLAGQIRQNLPVAAKTAGYSAFAALALGGILTIVGAALHVNYMQNGFDFIASHGAEFGGGAAGFVGLATIAFIAKQKYNAWQMSKPIQEDVDGAEVRSEAVTMRDEDQTERMIDPKKTLDQIKKNLPQTAKRVAIVTGVALATIAILAMICAGIGHDCVQDGFDFIASHGAEFGGGLGGFAALGLITFIAKQAYNARQAAKEKLPPQQEAAQNYHPQLRNTVLVEALARPAGGETQTPAGTSGLHAL